MEQRIHFQAGYGNTTDSSQSYNAVKFRVKRKMLFPDIAAWMKEANRLRFEFIPSSDSIRLKSIAGSTGQGEIIMCVVAACGTWMDMLNFKAKVKRILRGVAIRTSEIRTSGNN